MVLIRVRVRVRVRLAVGTWFGFGPESAVGTCFGFGPERRSEYSYGRVNLLVWSCKPTRMVVYTHVWSCKPTRILIVFKSYVTRRTLGSCTDDPSPPLRMVLTTV